MKLEDRTDRGTNYTSGLAYIGRVNQLFPIEGADRIESAEVVCGEGGKWRGVVGKGQYKLGDVCIVYLQDAIVKPSPELAFLEKTKWRVKMQKFRGSPSECVVMPLMDSPLGRLLEINSVGEDVTSLLGVTKYVKELPTHLSGDAAGYFPDFVPKTDELNFQTARPLVEALRGQPWYATVKYDGSSTTAYKIRGKFGVCSRNLEWQHDQTNAYWQVARKYDLENKLPDGYALQWETCGPGIQKNPLGLPGLDGFAFDLWDIERQSYCSRGELEKLCDSLGMPIAALVVYGSDFQRSDDELRSLAEGTYPNGKQREGIVIRSCNEQWVMCKRNRCRLSFKVINLGYKD